MGYHLTERYALAWVDHEYPPEKVLELRSALLEFLFSRDDVLQVEAVEAFLLDFSQNVEPFEGVLREEHEVE